MAKLVAFAGQTVEIVGRRELGDLEVVLGRGPADDQREVVRRTGRRAEGPDLGVDEGAQALGVEQRLGLLEEVGLVGRAAPLGHEEELVGVAVGRVELDLRRQVVLRVLLDEHAPRRELGVAQVGRRVGVEDAAGERRLVTAAGQHVLPLLAHDDRRAGVLAHRQHPAGGDRRVLQQVEGDEVIVRRRLRVVEDPPQLGEVLGPQEVGDVPHRLAGQQGQPLWFHLQEGLAVDLDRRHVVAGDQAVGGRVLPEGQHLLIAKVAHAGRISLAARGGRPLCPRSAPLDRIGVDEMPLSPALPPVLAGLSGPAGATTGARDFCHGQCRPRRRHRSGARALHGLRRPLGAPSPFTAR